MAGVHTHALISVALAALVSCTPQAAQKANTRAATQSSSSDFTISAPETASAGESISVSWAEVQDASFYSLIAANDKACQDSVIKVTEITETSQTIVFPSSGTYYLCVTYTNADGLESAAGSAEITIEGASTTAGGDDNSSEEAAEAVDLVATSVAYVVQPDDALKATALTSFSVEVRDQFGARLTTASGNVSMSFSENPGSATLGGTTSVALSSGVATFTNVSISEWSLGYKLLASFGALSVISSQFHVYEPIATGDGSSGTPYEITSLAELQTMNYYKTSSFILKADLDASSASTWDSNKGFLPIGNCGDDNDCSVVADNECFSGAYDGDRGTGYNTNEIRDLPITRPTLNGVGLFGCVDSDDSASLYRVALKRVSITGNNHVGAVVGYHYGGSQMVSGFATGTVSGAANIGGLIGTHTGSGTLTTNAEGSYSYVNVTGTGDKVGGLIGASDADVKACYATGSVNGVNYVGGLIGDATGEDILLSYATGDVSGTSYLGGLVGQASAATITNSYSTSHIKGTSFLGGLVGIQTGAAAVTQLSYATGHVIAATSDAGGLVGSLADSASVTLSFASGKVNTATRSGGLVGINAATGTVTKSFWHDHKANPASCVGSDSNATATDCVPKYDGVNPDLNPVSFAPRFLDGRMIGESDKSTFRVWGQCSSEGETIHVAVIQGGSNLTPTTQPTCSMGRFTTTVDVSTLTDDDTINDASNDIKVTIEADWGGCTQGTDCYIDARALLKDATTCDSYTTIGNGYAAGTGVDTANAFIICDATQFDNIRNDYDDFEYFTVGNNIDFADEYQGRIGVNTTSDFNGLLEGSGFRLSGLHLHDPTGNSNGIFGVINDSSAYIQNLTIEDSSGTFQSVGGLFAGDVNLGTLSSLTAHGHVMVTTGYGGGIAGQTGVATSITSAKSYVHLINNNTNFGDLGGVVGLFEADNPYALTDSHAYGHVSATHAGNAGIAGEVNGTADFTSNHNYAHIIAASSSGGAIGKASTGGPTIIDDSSSHGNVLSDNVYVGGFVGRHNGTITNSFSRGNVLSSSTNIGGFVGHIENSGSIESSFATGGVWGDNKIGGFIGSTNNTPTINECFATGDVHAVDNAGGFIGRTEGGTFTSLYATGNVIGTAAVNGYLGGFGGYVDDNVDGAYATGNVEGIGANNGGFAGLLNSSDTLDNVWASGHVDAGAETGGLVGDSRGDITNAFASGLVTSASASSGGVIGEQTASGTTTRVFWHEFTGNKSSCVGSDSGTSDCYSSFNAAQKSTADVAFAPWYKDGRKAGASDVSSFILQGSCSDWSASIYVVASDGSNSENNTATCRTGSWIMSIDLSGHNEGNITVTAEEQDGSCTPSSTCSTATLTVDKETTACDGVYVSDTADFTSGTGVDAANAYLICTREQLANIEDYATSGVYFKLGNNIDLSGEIWETLTDGTPASCAAGGRFCGSFDGDGFRVDNMMIIKTTDYTGLFGMMHNAAGHVQNLGMEHAYIIGGRYVGVLSGRTLFADVSNTYAVGNITASSTYVGVLLGKIQETGSALDGSGAYGNIIGDRYVSGLSGLSDNAAIVDSYNEANVLGTGSGTYGGISYSALHASTIDTSYSSGNIISQGYQTGGLVGAINNTAVVSDSYATGNTVSSSNSAAGLVGELASSTAQVQRCYATGNIMANDHDLGGLVGDNKGDIDDSFSTGLVQGGGADIGGAIGETSVSTVTNVHYYDQTGNPSATCAANGSPTSCTANSTLTDFHDQSPGSQNAPIDTFDFGTPDWQWDPTISDFPVLDWQ